MRKRWKPAEPKWLRLLRQYGATTHTRSESDTLCNAVRDGDLRAVKKQLADGADINGGDGEFGVTALSWAALLDEAKIAQFLIEKGADVNAKSRDGSTPLHSAAFLGRVEIAELLIQKSADVNQKNFRDETPLDASVVDWDTTNFIAGMLKIKVEAEKVRAGRAKVVEILRQHGSEH